MFKPQFFDSVQYFFGDIFHEYGFVSVEETGPPGRFGNAIMVVRSETCRLRFLHDSRGNEVTVEAGVRTGERIDLALLFEFLTEAAAGGWPVEFYYYPLLHHGPHARRENRLATGTTGRHPAARCGLESSPSCSQTRLITRRFAPSARGEPGKSGRTPLIIADGYRRPLKRRLGPRQPALSPGWRGRAFEFLERRAPLPLRAVRPAAGALRVEATASVFTSTCSARVIRAPTGNSTWAACVTTPAFELDFLPGRVCRAGEPVAGLLASDGRHGRMSWRRSSHCWRTIFVTCARPC